MKIVHIDSSALGSYSVSRQLTADIVAELKHGTPDATVNYRDLAAQPQWAELLRDFPFRSAEVVESPQTYAGLLRDAGATTTDAWETTYVHELTGEHPVLEWIHGTALRPVRSALSGGQWEQFRSELAPVLAEAYPQRADGTTFFPFRRIFVVAQVGQRR